MSVAKDDEIQWKRHESKRTNQSDDGEKKINKNPYMRHFL